MEYLNSIALHFSGASSEKIEAHEMHLGGLKLFFEKNYGKISARFFLAICIFSAVIDYLFSFLVFDRKKRGFCKRIIKVCWKEFS